MKVAIPLRGERVAPRVAFAEEVLIVTLKGGREIEREVLEVSHLHPSQLPALLASKGVTKLIAGGVDLLLQRIFLAHRIEVIWGVIGRADEVLAFYLRYGIPLGMGPCPPRGRRRRRRGSFPGP